MALATIDYLKSFLGITSSSTDEDASLQIYLDAACAAFKTEVGRDLESTTYPSASTDGPGDSGFYSGNGSRILVVRQRPLVSISALYLDASGRFGVNPDGSFATATQLVYGTDFVIPFDGCLPGTSTKCSYAGFIERVGTVWPGRVQYSPGTITMRPIPHIGNIKVAYTAGFTTVPPDIKVAVCQVAAFIRSGADKGGPLQSESLGGYSYSRASAAMGAPEMGTVRSVVRKYKQLSI